MLLLTALLLLPMLLLLLLPLLCPSACLDELLQLFMRGTVVEALLDSCL